jgi:hypothetical protein
MMNFAATGGLFEHFEINREPFWPRVGWLLAGSAVWHLVLVAFIVTIPPVRDALSIAALFSGADFVDRPYSRTEIGNDAEIIELTSEKFTYPEGYFLMDQQGMPSPTPLPVMPSFTPSFVPSATSPTPTPTAEPSPVVAGKTDPQPSPSPSAKTAEQAQKDLESASKRTGIELPKEGEINKAPFKDLAAHATSLKDQGKLDFNQPFEVRIETTLDKDGKLVNPKVTRTAGDVNLVDLGTRLVAAMNDSGVLFYLKKINEDKPDAKVIFIIKQDANEVTATVESEVTSASSANKLSRGFGVMLAAGAETRKGKDEEILLKSTKVSAEGNKVIFKLTMARQDAVDLVKRGLVAPEPSVTPG